MTGKRSPASLSTSSVSTVATCGVLYSVTLRRMRTVPAFVCVLAAATVVKGINIKSYGHIVPNVHGNSLAAVVACNSTYAVTSADGQTCVQIEAATGVNVETLKSLNSDLNCSSIVPLNTYLCLTEASSASSVNCLLSYLLHEDDLCSALQSAYDLDSTSFLLLNPDLDCSVPAANTLACLEGTFGSSSSLISGEDNSAGTVDVTHAASCSGYYTVASSTACLDAVSATGISLTDLATWNTGLNCWGLSQNDTLCTAVNSSVQAVFTLPSPTSSKSTAITSLEIIAGSTTSTNTIDNTSAVTSTVQPAAATTATTTTTTTTFQPVAVSIQPTTTTTTTIDAPVVETSTAAASPAAVQSQSSTSTVIQASSSDGSYTVSWNWFTGPTSDCDSSITATEYNTGYYAGAQKTSSGTIPCGETGTFTYNGVSVSVVYAWQTTGGSGYHELTPQAFAKLIGSSANVADYSTPQAYQTAINDPGRIIATCSGVC
ncbi:hypothetical protein HK100_000547 [Physocladia obscura]|uniref:LysM domain-containing protein n=1 Tax=Physocladia obscura TaxID=109957 RepID=A0AAD5T8Q8_9FUNG|nr:hypothetical protein HK100_000547 [Physocladia obscura]